MKTLFKTLNRYAEIYWALCKVSLISELEYRANILSKVLVDFIWYAAQLSMFEVLFRHTQKLADWNVEQMRVFMGIVFLADGIYMVFFQENLDQLSQKVTRGELDLILSKPVASQFMVSFQKVNVPYVVNIALILVWINWALSRLPGGWQWDQAIRIIPAAICGAAVFYSLRFALTSLALVFSRADAIAQVWYQFYKLGLRPHGIYPPWLRMFVLAVLPVAFIASVPAQVVLGNGNIWVTALLPVVSTGLVVASSVWWRRALKSYSSASS